MSHLESVNPNRGTVVPNGGAVRAARLARGWDQARLALEAGVVKRTIENVEGGRSAQVTTLRVIAEKLGVHLANLVCESARPLFVDPLSPPPADRRDRRPAQLPMDLADAAFVGRAAELDAVRDCLRAADGRPVEIAAVGGMGGVGKTTLAVRAGHSVKDRFPAGNLFLDLGGRSFEPMTVPRAMCLLAHAVRPDHLFPAPDDQAAVAGDYRTIMADAGAVLVVLDNVADADQVRPLLLGPPAGVLVTSRRSLHLDRGRAIPLDAFPDHESIILLRGILGRGPSDEQLGRLADACGHLPLALSVAGSYLKGHPDWSADAFADLVGRNPHALQIGGDEDRDVMAVLGTTATQLAGEDRELAYGWHLLAALPEIGELEAAAAWGIDDPDEVHRRLSALCDWSLLSYHPKPGVYRMHDLLRRVAGELFAAEAGDGE